MTSQNATINAVVVNHNTSTFTELAARSFFAMHGEREDVRFTIMDNSSQDGTGELEEYARTVGIEFRRSGFVAAEQQVNSHGEVLRQFVMENPECDYYLLLDADICRNAGRGGQGATTGRESTLTCCQIRPLSSLTVIFRRALKDPLEQVGWTRTGGARKRGERMCTG